MNDFIMSVKDSNKKWMWCERCHIGPAKRSITLPTDLGLKYFTIPQLSGLKKYTYSEFKKALKKNNLMEANDRIGGAKESPFRGKNQPKKLKPHKDVETFSYEIKKG